MRQKLTALYLLTKPGIVRGNILHTLAGAFAASINGFALKETLAVTIGTALVVASACIVNNYMDRSIDARMERTKKRPSVTGNVSSRSAHIFATILGLIGFVVLAVWTNYIVVLLGVIAYVTYVWVYGYAKRRTVHSTLVGAIPGALPAMAGYVGVTGTVSLSAWLIFALVFIWQIPHFYAIAIFRRKEYKKAKVPIISVRRPFESVRLQMLVYLALYVAIIGGIISLRIMGNVSSGILLLAALFWVIVFFRVKTADHDKWAKSVFGASLVVTLMFFVASFINVFLPPVS